jgi:hypothetical protein
VSEDTPPDGLPLTSESWYWAIIPKPLTWWQRWRARHWRANGWTQLGATGDPDHPMPPDES